MYRRPLDNTASFCQPWKDVTRKGNKSMWSLKYGFLTSSPHDIGTGFEGQVKARLPKLIKVQTMDYITQPRSQSALLLSSKEGEAPMARERKRLFTLPVTTTDTTQPTLQTTDRNRRCS